MALSKPGGSSTGGHDRKRECICTQINWRQPPVYEGLKRGMRQLLLMPLQRHRQRMSLHLQPSPQEIAFCSCVTSNTSTFRLSYRSQPSSQAAASKQVRQSFHPWRACSAWPLNVTPGAKGWNLHAVFWDWGKRPLQGKCPVLGPISSIITSLATGETRRL